MGYLSAAKIRRYRAAKADRLDTRHAVLGTTPMRVMAQEHNDDPQPESESPVGALLGIDPAFQAARHGRYVGCPHAVLLFGRNPLIDHCPVS
jgi:hypothetical protein